VLLSYLERPAAVVRTIRMRHVAPRAGRIRVAIVGAGSFAQGTHIPNLLNLKDSFELRCVMSRSGSNAAAVAHRAEASYATTDYDQVLDDSDIDLVLIATRHNLHAELTLQALEAGKNVFVEKPLALSSEELERIEAFFAVHDEPLLMTGFNRRFSPAAIYVRELLSTRTAPVMVDYRMNAGYIPRTHWVQGPEGGGRNIGEACHIYDLFGYFVGAEPLRVRAQGIHPTSDKWLASDNFVVSIGYDEGSLCTLTYTALGHRGYPKEHMDIYTDGTVVSLNDYKSVTAVGARRGSWRSRYGAAKGHRQELEALATTLYGRAAWPVALESQFSAMRIAFAAERHIRGGYEAWSVEDDFPGRS
jgi:predicted dehydrogenase